MPRLFERSSCKISGCLLITNLRETALNPPMVGMNEKKGQKHSQKRGCGRTKRKDGCEEWRGGKQQRSAAFRLIRQTTPALLSCLIACCVGQKKKEKLEVNAFGSVNPPWVEEISSGDVLRSALCPLSLCLSLSVLSWHKLWMSWCKRSRSETQRLAAGIWSTLSQLHTQKQNLLYTLPRLCPLISLFCPLFIHLSFHPPLLFSSSTTCLTSFFSLS